MDLRPVFRNGLSELSITERSVKLSDMLKKLGDPFCYNFHTIVEGTYEKSIES